MNIDISFEKALNELPDGTGYDSFSHKTIEDLCYLCLHELDLVAEREYWHPIGKRKKYLNFCQKYGFYADMAMTMFIAAKFVSKSDIDM